MLTQSPCYVQGTILNALHIVLHLLFITSQWETILLLFPLYRLKTNKQKQKHKQSKYLAQGLRARSMTRQRFQTSKSSPRVCALNQKIYMPHIIFYYIYWKVWIMWKWLFLLIRLSLFYNNCESLCHFLSEKILTVEWE